ncbi:hypothetical protein PZ897_13795 [Hoeflea sp. YIM 152468]|uniref:hypothetical protein n=1 Tax=Hoeflea sp. YIM 152468 TaxID=3031759 RepID=UPI0023DCE1AF|nr:hypothetical protein [Hoeflea sp. YIM 152468]MDF1609254.1 hypothetical protein [Hoeflea sp. YIM 152468]
MPHGQSYLEWGAVWGGGVVAIATSTVLGQFGSTGGLALGDPMLASGEPSWQVLVASLWLFVMALASSAGGGYIAGRMRSRWNDAPKTEVEFRDGVHGLSVWAVSTIVVAAFAASAAALAALGVEADATATDLPANVVEYTQTITLVYGFATAAASALGAGAAWWFASLGGSHRDEGTDVHLLTPRFLRR